MRNSKKGFTIIEMVIVIAIIGILASVLIPTYGNVVNSANESAALQTARSTMTNWLASSTSSAGVPTSGTDANGNEFYAAYFEFKNGDNGQVYQFRYTSGGVERTDNNPSKYVDFTQTGSGVANLPNSNRPQYIAKAFLTTPSLDTNFDETKYEVSLYKQTVGTGDKVSTNYYVKYPATGAYSSGGADTYAAVPATLQVYVKNGTNYDSYYLGTAPSGATVITGWQDTPAAGTTATATTYTVTYSAGTTGQTLDATTYASVTTDAAGKVTITAAPTGYHWVNGTETVAAGEHTFTANTTLTLTAD